MGWLQICHFENKKWDLIAEGVYQTAAFSLGNLELKFCNFKELKRSKNVDVTVIIPTMV